MADYTPNLNLEKPVENENFRRLVINGNMDKVDAAVGNVNNLTTTSKVLANAINEVKASIPTTLPANGGNADTVNGIKFTVAATAPSNPSANAIWIDLST